MQGTVLLFIFISFYILGAYATTDILRLLQGAQLMEWNTECYCPICGGRIRLRDQLPILGYLLNKGTCRQCGSKIPFSDIFLEIFLFIGTSVIAVGMKFTWIGFLLDVLFYQAVKLFYLIKNGLRRDKRLKNIGYSLMSNTVIFSLIAILFGLLHL